MQSVNSNDDDYDYLISIGLASFNYTPKPKLEAIGTRQLTSSWDCAKWMQSSDSGAIWVKRALESEPRACESSDEQNNQDRFLMDRIY